MIPPTEPHANGSTPAAHGDLVNRVQQLRLGDQLGTGLPRRASGAWLPWVLCALLAVSWAGLGVRWYKAAAQPGEAPAGAKPAAAAGAATPQAAAAPGEILLQLKGNLIPVTQVPVSPEDVSGEVVAINFKEGDRVEKGKTVLARLREVRYRNEWVMAQKGRVAAEHRLKALEPNAVRESEKLERVARVLKAKANRVKAQLELNRQKGLMATGTGSQQDMDAAQNAFDTADAELKLEEAMQMQVIENSRQAAIDAAKADLEVATAKEAEAKRLLDNCVIKAPIDGTVLTKKADVGSLVSPMSFNVAASLCEIADLSKLEVEVDVPERQIMRVSPGLECTVVADADPGRLYRGRVDRVMPIADDTKNVVKIRVQVFLPPGEQPGSFLKPKMAAVVTVVNREVKAEK